MIGTLTVDGWTVTFGTARWGLGDWVGLHGAGWGCWVSPSSPLLTVLHVTPHPSTASAPTSYYSM